MPSSMRDIEPLDMTSKLIARMISAQGKVAEPWCEWWWCLLLSHLCIYFCWSGVSFGGLRSFCRNPTCAVHIVGCQLRSWSCLCLLMLWFMPRLKDDALICATPPCSLMGPACASVHRRSLSNPLGDVRRFKIRLSNRIWANFAAGFIPQNLFWLFFAGCSSQWVALAFSWFCSCILVYIQEHWSTQGTDLNANECCDLVLQLAVSAEALCLQLALTVRRRLRVVIEHPKGSWAFKLGCMMLVGQSLGLFPGLLLQDSFEDPGWNKHLWRNYDEQGI